ncbi:hypothetical protein FOZ63_010601, partial [Perkinsus olseni]
CGSSDEPRTEGHGVQRGWFKLAHNIDLKCLVSSLTLKDEGLVERSLSNKLLPVELRFGASDEDTAEGNMLRLNASNKTNREVIPLGCHDCRDGGHELDSALSSLAVKVPAASTGYGSVAGFDTGEYRT